MLLTTHLTSKIWYIFHENMLFNETKMGWDFHPWRTDWSLFDRWLKISLQFTTIFFLLIFPSRGRMSPLEGTVSDLLLVELDCVKQFSVLRIFISWFRCICIWLELKLSGKQIFRSRTEETSSDLSPAAFSFHHAVQTTDFIHGKKTWARIRDCKI